MLDKLKNLLDEEGENLAVRSFLMAYGTPGLTTAQMRTHMMRCGWENLWPLWAHKDGGHLTKAGAQLWIRYLFALEAMIKTEQPEMPEPWNTVLDTHGLPTQVYRRYEMLQYGRTCVEHARKPLGDK